MSPLLLAATTQQKIGIALAVILTLGWVGYILVHLRRENEEPPGSEIELAPNRRPYLNDEALEGPRLDRVLGVSFVLLIVSALGLPLYWAGEPSRHAGAEFGFDKRAVNRGKDLFQPSAAGGFGCGTCHGIDGSGGVAPYTLTDPANPDAPPRQVQWEAPPVNTALLRFSRSEVRKILVYGRPNTPMPAWGIEGGGPMNDQQIDDLVAYLESIKLSSKEARKGSSKVAGDGASLFNAYCARCHTKGWSYDEPEISGGGAFGPSLITGATLRQFPDPIEHAEFIATGTEFGKPYGVRGVGDDAGGGMPGFRAELSKEQIDAIVAYERSL